MKLLAILVLLISLGISGCIASKAKQEADNAAKRAAQSQPAQMNGDLHRLVIFGIILLGVGVAVYIFVPGDHKLAFAIIGASAAIGGTSLFIPIVMPLMATSIKIAWWTGMAIGVLVLLAKVWKNKRIQHLMEVTT